LDNSPYNNNQINAVLKDSQYSEPTLQNDQKYISYGDNNQADVAGVLIPPLKNNAVLQSAPNDGYVIKSPNQHDDAEDLPVDYNQIPAGTNQQEQYQTGTVHQALSLSLSRLFIGSSSNFSRDLSLFCNLQKLSMQNA